MTMRTTFAGAVLISAVLAALAHASAQTPAASTVAIVGGTVIDGNGNRADDLRSLVEGEGYLAKAPGKGEYEAIQKGRQALAQETANVQSIE